MKRVDVLLAMGSPALLKAAEEALLQEGLTVQTSGNGIDTVMDAIKTRPRCVLCGQVLSGMDGMKVCRLLNSLFSRREMPVIISVPDSKPEMRTRALSAGAVAVVDYSTPLSETADLIRLHLSESRGIPSRSTLDLSRDRILPMAAERLEDSLESLETIVRLAGDLRGAASVAEACRKVSAAVLWGLGFQRVWVGLSNRAGTEIEAVSYRGRGVTGDSIPINSSGRRLPVDMAISSGAQVSSWEGDLTGSAPEWAGSRTYVDTPIKSGSTVLGIIRCDNGLSKRKPSRDSLRSLRMLSDILSSFIRYLDARDRFEERTGTLDLILGDLHSASVTMDPGGHVLDYVGDISQIPGVGTPVKGTSLESLLGSFPEKTVKRIIEAMKAGKDIDLGPVYAGERSWTGISLRASGSREIVLTLADRSNLESMSERIKILESETDAVASLAADLTAESDAGEICRTMLRTLESFYPVESIAVMAAGESPSSMIPESLVVNSVSGSVYRNGALIPGATILVDTTGESGGIVCEAVRNCRITNIPDVMHCDFYIKGIAETRSELAIPMLSRGRVVGLIDIQSPEINRFHSDDLRRLNNVVGFAAGVLDAALQKTELINMARRDRLTGLHNMTFFEERYPEEFERAQRYEYPFSLIMMDIDDFKNYNDSFGHPMGNVLLQKVTEAMSTALRDVDILVRYGGEEFICILPLTEKQVAVEIAGRIRSKVIEANLHIPHAEEQPRGCVSLSLGVATFPVDSRERDELIELADQRMYRAKRAGKNRVCYT